MPFRALLKLESLLNRCLSKAVGIGSFLNPLFWRATVFGASTTWISTICCTHSKQLINFHYVLSFELLKTVWKSLHLSKST